MVDHHLHHRLWLTTKKMKTTTKRNPTSKRVPSGLSATLVDILDPLIVLNDFFSQIYPLRILTFFQVG